jgi:hypothetical protein
MLCQYCGRPVIGPAIWGGAGPYHPECTRTPAEAQAGGGSRASSCSAMDPVAITYLHNLCLLLIQALERLNAPRDIIEAITIEGDIQPAADWLAPNTQGQR